MFTVAMIKVSGFTVCFVVYSLANTITFASSTPFSARGQVNQMCIITIQLH